MTRLLAVGDLHLGRTPAALHADLQPRRAELGPEAAWRRCVATAIEHEVDGVVMSGDVVERSRDLLVAYGDLKQGIDQLAQAGIPVLAVAGNHDTLVLPRLAAEIDQLELLGAGGRWETRSIGTLQILGWSFPHSHVSRSPLEDLPSLDDPSRTIGLLHCDRDQMDSPYAPVSRRELDDAGLAAWLLGHIHQPDRLEGPRPSGYLGSVSALRASETGARGPWLLDWNGHEIQTTHIALAPLRFDAMDLDLSDVADPDDLPTAAVRLGQTHLQRLHGTGELPDVIGLRVRLTGTCRFERQLTDTVQQMLADSRPWQEGPVQFYLQRIDIATDAAQDLERLARQSDPCGLLAQRLLILADPAHQDHDALLEQGRATLLDVAQRKEFRALPADLDREEVRHWLEQAGRQALNQLLAQKAPDR